MDVMWIFFLLILFPFSSGEEVNLTFFQNDYDVKMDIAEYTSYDKSVIKNPKVSFVLYNRTQRVLNATVECLIDLKNNIMVSAQMYKLMSNEYRFFPVTINANACTEYNKNSFGIKDALIKSSNLSPCNHKKGIYYIHNLIPDFSKFPPHMPRGSYKLVSQILNLSNLFIQMDFYARIVDKPIDWKKLPKSKN